MHTTKEAAEPIDAVEVEVMPLAPGPMPPTLSTLAATILTAQGDVDMEEISRTQQPRAQTRFDELTAQYVVDHINGDSKNNTWTNLRWLRQQENIAAALGVPVRIIDTTTNEWQDYPCRTDASIKHMLARCKSSH
ncbi:hypothetical protein BC940DRAFT_294294 [Gongronella butleri]|nr:hypothetical protein BC940DRAFT_294294 [Gongronella butleri]